MLRIFFKRSFEQNFFKREETTSKYFTMPKKQEKRHVTIEHEVVAAVKAPENWERVYENIKAQWIFLPFFCAFHAESSEILSRNTQISGRNSQILIRNSTQISSSCSQIPNETGQISSKNCSSQIIKKTCQI